MAKTEKNKLQWQDTGADCHIVKTTDGWHGEAVRVGPEGSNVYRAALRQGSKLVLNETCHGLWAAKNLVGNSLADHRTRTPDPEPDDDCPAMGSTPEPTRKLVTEQTPPTPNDKPAVWPMVVHDMMARDEEGRRKYGVPLQPHNGRDVLVDAYQEALDLCVYLRQAIYERDGK